MPAEGLSHLGRGIGGETIVLLSMDIVWRERRQIEIKKRGVRVGVHVCGCLCLYVCMLGERQKWFNVLLCSQFGDYIYLGFFGWVGGWDGVGVLFSSLCKAGPGAGRYGSGHGTRRCRGIVAAVVCLCSHM
jgi:hypothetical protein